ncbi:hypothetical protein [Nevskia soli]|uniref:hypothetical protein n=1 Tax=Nevskia soli TaxID=418856 RepID=UPI0015D67B11|nr:hypothetical protein [Nevskia soli]
MVGRNALLILWPLAVFVSRAAEVKGLERRVTVQITSQMAGSPFAGDLPASVWALGFAPDQRYLAVGVEFIKKKVLPPLEDDKSYLLILATDHPETVIKSFEIPRHPAMRVYTEVYWSPGGKYIATPFYRDWDQAAIIDLSTNELHVITTRRCQVKGLLDGPQLVQVCSASGRGTRIRFIGIDGTVSREWSYSDVMTVLHVESVVGELALTRVTPGANTGPREITIADAKDRREIQRWMMTGAEPYFGTFAKSGKVFCLLQNPMITLDRDFICRDTSSGSEVIHQTLPKGFSGPIIGAGNYLAMNHDEIKFVPKPLQRLAGTSVVFGKRAHCLWDLRTGTQIAQWSTKMQFVLPGVDDDWAYTISPDGHTIAEGGTGIVTLYLLTQR